MSEKYNKQITEDEITINGIIDFFIDSWRIIILSTFLGFFVSISYLWLTPKEYVASALIQPARYSSSLFSAPILIEDSIILLSRIKQFNSFDADVEDACKTSAHKNLDEFSSKMIKTSLLKGVNLVELVVIGETPGQAIACAQSIFDFIDKLQTKMGLTLIEQTQSKINDYSDRLEKIINADDFYKNDLNKINYLVKRDEIIFLTKEIERFRDVILSVKNGRASLIAPIYAPKERFSPNTTLILILGVMLGSLVGSIFMLCKRSLKVCNVSHNLKNRS